RGSVTDDPESGRAIVITPRDTCRRERASDIALVRCRIGRIEGKQLADVFHPAAEKPAKYRRALDGAKGVIAVKERLSVRRPEAHVDVTAGARVSLVPFRHERYSAALLPCDLFRCMF